MNNLTQEQEAQLLEAVLAGKVLPPVNTKLVDGHLVDMTDEEILAGNDDFGKLTFWQKKLLEAQTYLNDTDYIAWKLAEGAATSAEYAEQIAKRQQSRRTINEAEAALAGLEGGNSRQ